MTEQQTFALLLGEAAMAVWGDMPRDIQEALFERCATGLSCATISPVCCMSVTPGHNTRRNLTPNPRMRHRR